MLKADIAKRIVEQIAQYTDYNVNIMNEKGEIIASKDESRIGTFHDVANLIISGKEDMVVISEDNLYPGVRPGINMVLLEEGRRIGVVGVTGNPNEIRQVAQITKAAIEAMMKYEHQQEAILKRQNRKERFINLLVHEEYPNPNMLKRLARELDYTEDETRIPILCVIRDGLAEPFLQKLKESPCHRKQDISIVLDDTHIIVFKTIGDGGDGRPAVYKGLITEYVGGAAERFLQGRVKYFVGSFQKMFTQYYFGYQHCQWLENTVKEDCAAAFFYDHVNKYLRSIIPLKEEQRIFRVYQAELGEGFLDTYVKVIGAVSRHNWNFSEAAKELFVHKNSLVYHYNKIKEKLNMNPLGSNNDRLFMEAFYYYLSKQK